MRNELVRSTVPHLRAHIRYNGWTCEEPVECSLHFHDEIELLAITQGSKTLEVNGHIYTLLPGDVAFLNSRVPHLTYDLPPAGESVLIQFRTEDFCEWVEDSSALRHLVRFTDKADENPLYVFRASDEGNLIYSYMLRAGMESREQKASYDICLRGWICLILGCLYREKLLRDTAELPDRHMVERVLPALLCIEEHFREDITLLRLATLCDMSEGYFCRQFKLATGSTFIEYLNYVRIYNAEKLLTHTSLSILDVAMEVGFSSVSYFNRMFRRFKNCTPNNYRRAAYLIK